MNPPAYAHGDRDTDPSAPLAHQAAQMFDTEDHAGPCRCCGAGTGQPCYATCESIRPR